MNDLDPVNEREGRLISIAGTIPANYKPSGGHRAFSDTPG